MPAHYYSVLLSQTGAHRAIQYAITVASTSPAEAALVAARMASIGPNGGFLRTACVPMRDSLLPHDEHATPCVLQDRSGFAVAYAYVVGPLDMSPRDGG